MIPLLPLCAFNAPLGRLFRPPFGPMLAGGGISTQTFSATKDTQVAGSSLAFRNYGAATTFVNVAPPVKGLIYFNLSSIPASAVCISATLNLYHAAVIAALAVSADVYAIAVGNNNWPEGNKNAATGTAGDSCWNYLDQTPGAETAWAGSAGLGTSGTDYEASSIGTLSFNRSDPVGTKYSIALTPARIQSMFGAVGQNYGLMLIPSANCGGFCSRTHATAEYQPALVVVYQG